MLISDVLVSGMQEGPIILHLYAWEVGKHWDWLSSPESNPLFHSRLDSHLTNLRAIR